MKHLKSTVLLGLLLVALSGILFSLQLYFFHAPRDTFFYLLQDLAFIPLQILIVTLVLEQILSARERQDKLRKINVVINAFFIFHCTPKKSFGGLLLGHLTGIKVNSFCHLAKHRGFRWRLYFT